MSIVRRLRPLKTGREQVPTTGGESWLSRAVFEAARSSSAFLRRWPSASGGMRVSAELAQKRRWLRSRAKSRPTSRRRRSPTPTTTKSSARSRRSSATTNGPFRRASIPRVCSYHPRSSRRPGNRSEAPTLSRRFHSRFCYGLAKHISFRNAIKIGSTAC